MFFDLIQHGAQFLAENPQLVAMVIAAEEFIKKFLGGQDWFNREWVKVVLAFVLGALFIIEPPISFSLEMVAEIIAIGGTAAGLFSAGQLISRG